MPTPTAWTVSHDFAFVFGGAERVTTTLLASVMPGSPLLYLAGSPGVVDHMTGGGPSAPLLPPKLVTAPSHRFLVAAYPVALARKPPIEGNLLASSYAFAHHVRCEGTTVIYCHSPLRQAWSGRRHYATEGRQAERIAVSTLGPWLRVRDQRAAGRAQLIVATSRAVRDRIREFYGRDEIPIVPPAIDHGHFHPDQVAKPVRRVYLWVGRIVEPYKRLSLVIEAMRDDPTRSLVVAGDGRDRARLEAEAPDNVTFLGWQPSTALAQLYRISDAVIFPSEDDFGLVPVEAMACGTPTIAFSQGGALDTIEDGVTGLHFHDATVPGLRKALDHFEGETWDRSRLFEISKRWSAEAFAASMREIVTTIG